MKSLHTLKIGNGVLTLDGFKLHGVTGYMIKNSGGNSTAELSLEMVIAPNLQVTLDETSNNLSSDLGQDLERK